jgi:hypothetical protein
MFLNEKICVCQPMKAITRIIPILFFAAQISFKWKIYLIKTEIVVQKKKPFWEQKGYNDCLY